MLLNLAVCFAVASVGCCILTQYWFESLSRGVHPWRWRVAARFTQRFNAVLALIFLLMSMVWGPLQTEFLTMGGTSMLIALTARLLLVDWLMIWWKAMAGKWPWDNLPPPPGAPAY